MILIGKTARVTAATNPDLIGLTGEVVRDGRDTLVLRTEHGEKTVPKHIVTLTVNGQVIDGAQLLGTHAARLKK